MRCRVLIAIGNNVLRESRRNQNKRQNAMNCEPNRQRYPPMCFAIFACGISKQSCAVNVIIAAHCRLSRAPFAGRQVCASPVSDQRSGRAFARGNCACIKASRFTTCFEAKISLQSNLAVYGDRRVARIGMSMGLTYLSTRSLPRES